jgi:predicted permease
MAGTVVNIAGRPTPKPGEELVADIDTVLPGYFHAMGIPLLAGRDFSAADEIPSSPLRFIVNQAFVRKYLPTENALDKQIDAWMNRENPFGPIIGVVGDLKHTLNEPAVPTVYYPHSHLSYNKMNLVVRAERDPQALIPSMQSAIKSVDHTLTLGNVRSMQQIVADTFARQTFSAILLAGFSLTSLVLAAIGIYGVLAYTVSERTREIGVRMALGAVPASITSLVLKSGARLLAGGLIAGTLGAVALTGFLKSLLFGVAPRDPVTYLLVVSLITAVALMASYVPARRAAHLDPLQALRSD